MFPCLREVLIFPLSDKGQQTTGSVIFNFVRSENLKFVQGFLFFRFWSEVAYLDKN